MTIIENNTLQLSLHVIVMIRVKRVISCTVNDL